jgi:hypothetical protein
MKVKSVVVGSIATPRFDSTLLSVESVKEGTKLVL